MTKEAKKEKPPLGAPCNGCGACCESAVCTTGTMLFANINRDDVPCPLLGEDLECTITNGKALAHLPFAVQDRIIELHKGVIGLGLGCDAMDGIRPELAQTDHESFGQYLDRMKERWDRHGGGKNFVWLEEVRVGERKAINRMRDIFKRNGLFKSQRLPK